MAINTPKMGTKGGDDRFDTSSIRGVREERGIVEGIVKANVHNANMGVISVWIPTFTTEENDKNQWRQVRYCTPFFSSSTSGRRNFSIDSKTSAGLITPPPDIGTKVLCFFPEGRNSNGYYFACVPDLYMEQSFPETTLNENDEPAAEVNDRIFNLKKVDNFKKLPRPKDLLVDQNLRVQGLNKDKIRGVNNSSVMRESPSEVIGLVSKGRRITNLGQDFFQTYGDSLDANTNKEVIDGLIAPRRRKGHSITLDDGDVNGDSNQIRLRTSTGHQILLNDTEGVIYIGNSTGTAWIELGATGTMDVYSADSINFRSANINFHADQNIKFHSNGFTQIVSEQQVHVEGKKQAVIVSQQGEAGISGSQGLHLQSGSSLFATAGGMAYMSAGGIMSVSGALVMLQGPRTPAKQGQPVSPLSKPGINWNGTEFAPSTETKTSVDRVVTHEPFAGHGAPNIPTPYTGGLVGGGGGLGGAFSIISAAGPLTAGFGAVGPGLDAFGGAGAAVGGGFGSFGSAFGGITAGLPSIGGINLSAITGGLDLSAITGGLDLGSITGGLGGIDLTNLGGIDLSQITGGLDLGSITGGLDLGAITGGLDLTSITQGIPGLDINALSQGIPGLDLGALANISGDLSIADLANNLPGGINLQDLANNLPGNINIGALADSLPVGLGEVTLADLSKAIPGDFSGAISAGSSFLPPNLTRNLTNFANSVLPGGLADTVLQSISKGGLDPNAITQFGIDRFVSAADGTIVNLADQANIGGVNVLEFAQDLGVGGGGINLANLADTFTDIVDLPISIDLPVTDIISQVDNGFSVGILDTIDVQALNAAVIKTAGTGGKLDFVDTITKSVGKYGFNVEQLKKTGLVNADAIFNDQLSNPSVWTGKLGASSLNDFLSNAQMQEEIQQALIVDDYQSLVNVGGIKTTDGPRETLGMLTASLNSTPELASLSRQGIQDIANTAKTVLTNRTNIVSVDNARAEIDKFIQTGSFASDLSAGIKKARGVFNG